MTPEDRVRAAAERSSEIALAVLFGSRARGDERRVSDTDVAVLLLDDSLERRRDVEAALGRAAGTSIDIVFLNTAPPQLRFEIARDSKVLVEREPHLWADFQARAMIAWWDWAPTARMLHSIAAEHLREQSAQRLRPARGAGGKRGEAAPPSASERGWGPASSEK
jgi:predicted nucleotidyltransferase